MSALDAEPHRASGRRRRVVIALVVVAVLLGSLAGVLFTPVLDGDLDVVPAPTTTYEDAMGRARTLLANDGEEVAESCRSRVVEQGHRTDRVVVLLHGFTNCPAQFSRLVDTYAASGWNVVVPRLPGHGYADRLTDALSEASPSDLVASASEAVDIAAGLGDRVTVVGLSGGGTLTAWLAGRRNDVAEAVLIAPLVVPKVLPELAVGPASRVFRFLPDIYLWWDGDKKASLDSPPHAYPRYSLRALGAFLAVGRAAQQTPSRSDGLGRLVVITNENDLAVSNTGVDRVAGVLTTPGVDRQDVVFPAGLGYRHDLVDPQGENAAVLDEISSVVVPALRLTDAGSSTP